MRLRLNTIFVVVLGCLALGAPGCKSPLDVDTPLKTLGRIYPSTVTISHWGGLDSNGIKVDVSSLSDMVNGLSAIVELDTLPTPGAVWLALQLKTAVASQYTSGTTLASVRLSTDSLTGDGLWRDLMGTHALLNLNSLSPTAGPVSETMQADGSKYIVRIRCFHVRERKSFTVAIEGSYIAAESAKPTAFDGEIIITY